MKERGLAPRGPPADARVLTFNATKEAPVSEQYAGRQIVGMDLHVSSPAFFGPGSYWSYAASWLFNQAS